MQDGKSYSALSLSPTSDGSHGKLACQACQRKKIKCSRTYPCEQCTRSNLKCIPSTRKPRTRHAGKRAVDSELRNRISKLESLVESLSGEGSGEVDDARADGQEVPPPGHDALSSMGKYIGSPFWSTLTMEVQSLRDALEEEPSDDDFESIPHASTIAPSGDTAQYDLLLLPPGVIGIMPGALSIVSQELSAKLCEIFIANVDCVFRLFHLPSLRAMMIEGSSEPYMGQDPASPAIRFVKASIWFAAVTSMKDHECIAQFGQQRGDVLALFRRHVDVAMNQADVLNTTDLSTVQAFLTYIVCLRLLDTGRRVWTMTAILVRIATGMGLHCESVPQSVFTREFRRRLWYGVRFIDMWTGIDRGTEPLIQGNSCSTPMPSNVNDDEFDEFSTDIIERKGLTQMSLAHMSHLAVGITVALNRSEDQPTGKTWQQRYEEALAFKQVLEENVLQYCDSTIPFERYHVLIGRTMASSIQLRAIRPTQRHLSSIPPPIHSPFVLKSALEHLKTGEALEVDPEVQQWRWMVWVSWYALAITLAGLCFHRDSDLANEAWPVVERTYERNARLVADTRNGMLWRPIEKLYKKAVEFRDHGTTQDISPFNIPGGTPTPQLPSARLQYTYETAAASNAALDLPSSSSDPIAESQYPAPTADNLYATPNASTAFTTPDRNTSLRNNGPYPQTVQQKNLQSNQLNHNNLPHGTMPLSGNANLDIDWGRFSAEDTDNSGPNQDTTGISHNLASSDINWMDFERIFEDISNPAIDTAMLGGPGGGDGANEGFGSEASWPYLPALPSGTVEPGWPSGSTIGAAGGPGHTGP